MSRKLTIIFQVLFDNAVRCFKNTQKTKILTIKKFLKNTPKSMN